MKKSNKKYKITKFEKFIYTLTIVIAFSYPFISVFSKSMLSKVNYEVEEAKEDIAYQNKTNDSLEMQINELASLGNLESVAKSQGLSYTYNSVKTVE